MVKTISFLACRLLCWSGLTWLLRETIVRGKVTIINYHKPSPVLFEEHARFFARNYTFVSIDQILDALEKGSILSLPPKSLLITFDDGYAENAQLLPILQQYHIPAVIYAVAGVVGTKRHFWFDKIPHHGQVMTCLKNMPDRERRSYMRTECDHWDEKEYEYSVALSHDALKLLADQGITVGSHTMFHPMLDCCDDETGIRECKTSRLLLEDATGKPVVHFALPNGNGNEIVLGWIRKAGYRSCRTTKSGWVTSKTSCFFLPDFGVSDDADISKVAIQTCGVWDFFKQMMRR